MDTAGIVLVAVLVSGFLVHQKLNQAQNLLDKARADMGDALSVAGDVAALEEEATTSIEDGIAFLKSVRYADCDVPPRPSPRRSSVVLDSARSTAMKVTSWGARRPSPVDPGRDDRASA